MLAQRSIHLWEGERLIPRENADTKSASCSSAVHLQRRRRVKVSSGRRNLSLTVQCSQGIPILPKEENSKEVFVRVSDGGASQSCLDGTDVRIASPRDAGNGDSDTDSLRDGMPGFSCEESGMDDSFDGVSTRVSLRSPEPLTEGWPDSFSSSDYAHISDRYLNSGVRDVEFVIDMSKGKNSLKEDVSPIEKFARARAAGKELMKRKTKGGGSGSGVEEAQEGVYYEPKVGDYVIGTVESGNYGKLDINIGAKKLAHLFRKDVMPLDICNVREMSWELPGDDLYDWAEMFSHFPGPAVGPRYVHDEEVLNLGLEVTMLVEKGTVFTMEVKGVTPTGIALLSARSVARGYAWQRIRQLQEQNATLELQITEWTPAGLIAKIEIFLLRYASYPSKGVELDGLRAFLPIYNLVNRPSESSTTGTVSFKEYVGQIFSVMIHSIDEMKSNLIISEKKAWVTKNAYTGALVDGIVTDIQPYGVHLRIKDTDLSGVLHISNISRARIDDIGSLFTVGEEVRVMVIPSNIKRRISFSTADLEIEDGLMLRNKEAVYRGAKGIGAEIAKAYENRNSESTIDSDDNVDVGEQEIVIANWDWLDFGDKANLD